MNELIIPPSSSWYLSNIFDCSSDNVVVYGSRKDLVVIKPRDSSEPANIRLIISAHSDKITALALNNSTWDNPDKLLATAGEDKKVKLWDMNKLQFEMLHKEHEKDGTLIIGIAFAKDRVISVTELGSIKIWRISTNTVNSISNLFERRTKIRCMSSCPHAAYLTAFGLESGVTIIADLRRTGKIIYKLCASDDAITSLAWCPSPYNIYKTTDGSTFDFKKRNEPEKIEVETVQTKEETIEPEENQSNSDEVEEEKAELEIDQTNTDIFDVEYPEFNLEDRKHEYKKVDKQNPWNVSCNESTNETHALPEKDFLEECSDLRNTILVSGVENLSLNADSLTTEHEEVDESKDEKESLQENPKRFIRSEPSKDYLLATASRNGVIHIWRTSDGRMQLFLPVHSTDKYSRNAPNLKKWVSICWTKPDILLVSASSSQLYCWKLLPSIDFNKKLSKNALFKPRLVHNDHSKQIFSIATPYKLYPEIEKTESWESLNGIPVWTTSKDRWILCTSLGTDCKTLVSYPCFSGSIACIAVSPIDPTKLAIGIADNFVRIWNLSYPHTQIIKMISLYESFKHKITFIDWHPTKENLIAFATSEGRIGDFNISLSKSPEMYSQYHRNTVYKIQWGPHPEFQGEFALYSSSGGELIYHENSSSEPIKIEVADTRVTTFSWKSNYKILAVGSKEGHVKLLSHDFTVLETFYMQRKSVQCLMWHPESTIADNGLSEYVNYLAVSTNESNIFVYNCTDQISDNKLVAELKGHKCCVKCLGWCPHIGGRLVSCSEDGITMIWDVLTQSLLSSYKDFNKNSISYVLWSPLDADLVICGGRDSSLRIFRISKHPPIIYQEEKKEKKQKSIKSKENTEIASYDQDTIKKLLILPEITRLQNPEYGNSIATCKKLLEIYDEAQNMELNNESSDEDDETTEVQKKIEISPVQLFGSRKDIKSVLNFEQEAHLRRHRWDSFHHLSLWKGDLATSIKEALKTGIITPWIISMAPMVSHKLWSELCLKYAEKLAEDGNALMASSYYLVCHQVEKAIDILCKNNMYREALAIAKCRLSSNDPIVNSIYEQWASYATFVGNFEIAAQCYICLGKLSEAGIILNKRSDVETLDFAYELAKRCDNNDLQIAVNAKLKIFHQEKAEQEDTKEKIEEEKIEKENDSIINICKSRFEALMSSAKKDAPISEKNNFFDELD